MTTSKPSLSSSCYPESAALPKRRYSVSAGGDAQGGLIGVDEDDAAVPKQDGEQKAHVPAFVAQSR